MDSKEEGSLTVFNPEQDSNTESEIDSIFSLKTTFVKEVLQEKADSPIEIRLLFRFKFVILISEAKDRFPIEVTLFGILIPFPFRFTKEVQLSKTPSSITVESSGILTLINADLFRNAAFGMDVCFVTLIVVKEEGIA